MSPEIKTCLNCGKPIVGRVDKKFCDDQCRNTFNNQQSAASNNLIRNINHALKKNRNILEALIPEGDELTKTTRDRLLRAGFQFKYFTHLYQNKKGNLYHYCYDFGYLALEGDWFLVVKGKEI
ncbi:MAG: DUF2116 family Zn-ribbon domain-containing protein [Algoriphagus sp.]|nr:DUF2116 family Zn-ribbon domain-containing protein [Algoriphagus sp.]